MPIFGRRNNANTAPAATGVGKTGGRVHQSHFTLGLWFRLHGADLICMALMGALGLGIFKARPAPSRSFPLFSLDGNVVYPQFAYPLRKEILPIWLAALLAFMVPWVFFTLFQIRRRSLNDYLTTIMGLLKSLITAAVFQVWLKWLIGGLRPHFYAACQPTITQNTKPTGIGFAGLMYDRTVCTGDEKEINDSLESFPSGHSTAAFAGFIFLALYFNAQLKVMSAHNSAYWKMILFFCPILGATLIAGSLTIDEFHNWYDVLAGAIIGTSTALVAFRQTFASIFDFRFNHILLPRTTSWFHRTASSSATGLGGQFYTYDGSSMFNHGVDSSMIPVTREAGWGMDQEAFVGAPGDATVLLGGMGGASRMGGGMGMGGRKIGQAEAGLGQGPTTTTATNGQYQHRMDGTTATTNPNVV